MPVEVEAESIITLLTYAEKNWHDLPDWAEAESIITLLTYAEKNWHDLPDWVVEAESIITLLTYAEKNWHDLPDWVIAEYDKGNIVFRPEGMDIITEEGVMTGNPADILIQGVEGEIYPCKASIFDATYELVKE